MKPAVKFCWKGKRVLITSGPTREYLDPIRFLTNASSGGMGFALARAARDRGAKVMVISGPSQIDFGNLNVIQVMTAREMHRKVLAHYLEADIFIAAAAVGDWRFDKTSKEKIKKKDGPFQVTLIPNIDIVADISKRIKTQKKRTALIGFALETHRWLDYAREKMLKKGLDLIVANKPNSMGTGEAQVAILDRSGGIEKLPPMSKRRAAERILRRAEKFLCAMN